MGETALPRMLGRYRLDAVLGRGAMGVVYKAYDPVIDRAIAIKVVHAELLDGEERANFRTFFRREAQAAGRCMHPNVVTVYDFSDEGDEPFIAMEFVEGATLHSVLRRQPRLAVAPALHIIRQVLGGLGYAHRLQIVHRDVKPANVILQRDGHVKITDFGVARIGRNLVTHAGGIVGTPSYMSPEQLSGGTVDGRTDLFAAGAMLYEMLTGAKPFPGRDAAETMAMILHRDPPEPADLGVDLPWALEAALRRALAKRPEDRFPSAAEFARALDLGAHDAGEAAAGEGAEATVIAPARSAAPLPAAGLDERTLRTVEADLAQHIGPMARVLVKQAAGSSGSLGELYRTLAPHIGDAGQRTMFLRKAGAPPSVPPSRGLTATGTTGGAAPAGGLVPEQVAAAQEALTLYLGPIARVLVKQALAQATSPRDFYDRLAAHIQRDDDRLAFRRKLSRDWGPDLRR